MLFTFGLADEMFVVMLKLNNGRKNKNKQQKKGNDIFKVFSH